LGESIHCLDDEQVRKVPLTVDAVNVPYDITRQQPQLFVTASCKHLSQVLEEFAASMAFRRGGAESLLKARDAGSVCTARYDSGVQVSGRVADVLTDAVGNVTWFRTVGPTQLAFRDTEIYGHGTDSHAEGFSAPVGMLKDFSRCLSEYTVDELRAHAIELDQTVCLQFLSGITVQGTLRAIHRQEHRNLLLGFDECTVTNLAGEVLYRPEWGRFDMAVGARIDSVYGGTADREAYQLYEPLPSTTAAVAAPDSALMDLYQRVDRIARGEAELVAADVDALRQGLAEHPREWLLRVELQRIESGTPEFLTLRRQAAAELESLALDAELAPLLSLALEALPEVA
jgi:phenylalanine-4-hydroxylase